MSTARDHDTTIDLSKRGIIVHRDRGYFGHDPKGIDGTMDRSVRNHKLSIESIRRGLMISRKRSLVEYPYAIMWKGISFFTCDGYNSEKSERKVHVYMLRIQCTCS